MVSFEHDGCMVQSSFNKEPKMKYKNINGAADSRLARLDAASVSGKSIPQEV